MLALLLYAIQADREENATMMHFLSQSTSTENESVVVHFLSLFQSIYELFCYLILYTVSLFVRYYNVSNLKRITSLP